MAEPEVRLFDEPTRALDASVEARLLNLLAALRLPPRPRLGDLQLILQQNAGRAVRGPSWWRRLGPGPAPGSVP